MCRWTVVLEQLSLELQGTSWLLSKLALMSLIAMISVNNCRLIRMEESKITTFLVSEYIDPKSSVL